MEIPLMSTFRNKFAKKKDIGKKKSKLKPRPVKWKCINEKKSFQSIIITTAPNNQHKTSNQ